VSIARVTFSMKKMLCVRKNADNVLWIIVKVKD